MLGESARSSGYAEWSSKVLKIYERKVLRFGLNRLRLISAEAPFAKETQGMSKYTTTGWAVDDFEYAIGKQHEGPSIGERIKTIAEVVEIMVKKIGRQLG